MLFFTQIQGTCAEQHGEPQPATCNEGRESSFPIFPSRHHRRNAKSRTPAPRPVGDMGGSQEQRGLRKHIVQNPSVQEMCSNDTWYPHLDCGPKTCNPTSQPCTALSAGCLYRGIVSISRRLTATATSMFFVDRTAKNTQRTASFTIQSDSFPAHGTRNT